MFPMDEIEDGLLVTHRATGLRYSIVEVGVPNGDLGYAAVEDQLDDIRPELDRAWGQASRSPSRSCSRTRRAISAAANSRQAFVMPSPGNGCQVHSQLALMLRQKLADPRPFRGFRQSYSRGRYF